MAPAAKSSLHWRAAYCTLNYTDFRRRTSVSSTWAIRNPSQTLPVWADVFRDPMQWPLRHMPWHAPVWDTGAGGSAFSPGFVCILEAFRDEVVLQDYPFRNELISCWCSEHGSSSTEVPCMFYGDHCCSCGEHLFNQ